jgi:hypothetical protein
MPTLFVGMYAPLGGEQPGEAQTCQKTARLRHPAGKASKD